MDNQRARLGQIALMMMTFSAVYYFSKLLLIIAYKLD